MTLTDSIKDFFAHCTHEKNLSCKTVKAYGIDLKQFALFLKDIQTIENICKIQIRNYLASISSLKPRTIKRKSATIKAFFNYLEFEDLIILNPLRKMRIKIKEPQVLFSVMDINEVKKIFRIIYQLKSNIKDKSSYSYLVAVRNIVVMELLFATGARVSEISNLQRTSLNFRTGNITIKGKGNRERIIQVCNSESMFIINEYCILVESHKAASIEWLLVNRLNKKLSDQSIRSIVKNICLKAGIKRNITPHSFRHTFATLLLENNVDIRYIQTMLGHSSIMTTQIYTHVNYRRQRQILITKHPRKNFSFKQPILNNG